MEVGCTGGRWSSWKITQRWQRGQFSRGSQEVLLVIAHNPYLRSETVRRFVETPAPLFPVTSFFVLGSLPVNLVLVCLGMYCNVILGVLLFHCCFVLTKSLLWGSPCFSLMGILCMEPHRLYTPSFVLSGLACFTLTRTPLRVLVFTPSGCTSSQSIHWLLWHMEGVGAWAVSGFLCVSLPLYHRFRIAIGPEHLSEVLNLLPLLSIITYLLCSDPQALHDTSEYLGRRAWVRIVVSVYVCPFSEDRDVVVEGLLFLSFLTTHSSEPLWYHATIYLNDGLILHR